MAELAEKLASHAVTSKEGCWGPLFKPTLWLYEASGFLNATSQRALLAERLRTWVMKQGFQIVAWPLFILRKLGG